MTKKIEAPTVR